MCILAGGERYFTGLHDSALFKCYSNNTPIGVNLDTRQSYFYRVCSDSLTDQFICLVVACMQILHGCVLIKTLQVSSQKVYICNCWSGIAYLGYCQSCCRDQTKFTAGLMIFFSTVWSVVVFVL